MSASAAVDRLVDWELAAVTAAAVSRPGPAVTHEQAGEVVAELRRCAEQAVEHVSRVTGMQAQGPDRAAATLVVDRPGWARANVQAFRTLLAPAADRAMARRSGSWPGPAGAVGRRLTGLELGGLLGVLASRVLGQYDPFGDGRLLLVAPNVVHVERELSVDAGDFRLWVCLHEQTHRLQFAASPWLSGHVTDQISELTGDLLAEPGQFLARLRGASAELPKVLRGESSVGLVELVQTPAQREQLARLTAVMSLLEGHADVVMDDVGPQVVPSVGEIRRKFGRRRANRGGLDGVLRRLLGLDAKMRQYTEGAAFVRGVVARVGMQDFNAVWSGPEALPRPAEIADPAAWVRRVHG